MLKVTCKGKTLEFSEGSTFEDAAVAFADLYDQKPLLAITSDYNHATELFHKIYGDVELKFLTHDDLQGRRAYMRTAELMLLRALYDEYGEERLAGVKVEFGIDGNLFISFSDRYNMNQAVVDRLGGRMKKYVADNDPIKKDAIKVYKARKIFEENGLQDLSDSLKYRNTSSVNYYIFGDYADYFYGPLCASAGYIRNFSLELYDDGLMLILPKAKNEEMLNRVVSSDKMFSIQRDSVAWAEKLGIDDVTDLNQAICDGRIDDVILMQEAFFEKTLGDVAAKISESGKRVVLLAGPSSSGKTTTSYRLAIQLRAFGLNPMIISADNYFVDGDKRVPGPDGKVDLESIDMVDTEQLNKDLLRLLAGETVEIPTFNFVTQKREYKGKTISLGPGKVLIIEGIHCLNPVFSEKIPDDSKFRIFISALTQLSINEHNPIPTSDMRLLRRMVRDHRTRGYSAARTISLWDGVRSGEEKNILPYTENADVIINSAMVYELAVLKLFVEPLLFNIGKSDDQYIEARRLLKLLSFALPVNPEIIPRTSILREFVGGSCIDID